MPRRAFRNGVSGGRHFGGVIHCSWTRASPIAASGQGWVRPPCVGRIHHKPQCQADTAPPRRQETPVQPQLAL